jgi:regulator of protease activity HflC (stomatin/prohibitin superfamily)
MIAQYVLIGVLAVIGLIVFFSTLFTIEQQSVGVIERFGKFHRTASAGLGMKLPIIDRIAYRVTLKVQQSIIKVETKTKDNVFVQLPIAVQFHVTPGKETDSVYKLENYDEQFESYILDVVRAKVPESMSLDDVFEKKDEIGNDVKARLGDVMLGYGFTIVNALVRDVIPDEGVKDAMNEIQKQTRLCTAAEQEGEAKKILAVKAAEADKETKKLSGEGVAAEREAIAEGIKKSTAMLVAATEGAVSAPEAMTTLMMTQYFDTLQKIGTSANSKAIFVPHTPAGLSDVRQQLMEAAIATETPTGTAPRKAD